MAFASCMCLMIRRICCLLYTLVICVLSHTSSAAAGAIDTSSPPVVSGRVSPRVVFPIVFVILRTLPLTPTRFVVNTFK